MLTHGRAIRRKRAVRVQGIDTGRQGLGVQTGAVDQLAAGKTIDFLLRSADAFDNETLSAARFHGTDPRLTCQQGAMGLSLLQQALHEGMTVNDAGVRREEGVVGTEPRLGPPQRFAIDIAQL